MMSLVLGVVRPGPIERMRAGCAYSDPCRLNQVGVENVSAQMALQGVRLVQEGEIWYLYQGAILGGGLPPKARATPRSSAASLAAGWFMNRPSPWARPDDHAGRRRRKREDKGGFAWTSGCRQGLIPDTGVHGRPLTTLE